MKKCIECNAKIEDDVYICPRCGSMLTESNTVSLSDVNNSKSYTYSGNGKITNGKSEGSKTALIITLSLLGSVLLIALFGVVIYVFSFGGDRKKEDGKSKTSYQGVTKAVDNGETELADNSDNDKPDKLPDNKDENDSDPVSGEEESEEESEEGEDRSADVSGVDWRQGYLDYLDTADLSNYHQASFIFVNDDEIPEIAFEGIDWATGCLILTIGNDGTVNDLVTGGLSFHFLPKQNLLDNNDGHMGVYYDEIYEIDNGSWKKLAEGRQEEYWPSEMNRAPVEGQHFYYTWDDTDVKWSDYITLLEDLYPKTEAQRPCYEGISDIKNKLKSKEKITEESTPAFHDTPTGIHRYEIFVEDVDWYGAFENCKDRGGYLLQINSDAEYDAVLQQIYNEGKEDKIFWLGATRENGEQDYRWVDSDFLLSKETLTRNSKYKDYWLHDEPSFYDREDPAATDVEAYVDMFMSKKEGRFVWNDVPGNLVSAVSSYRGKIAYICEYE